METLFLTLPTAINVNTGNKIKLIIAKFRKTTRCSTKKKILFFNKINELIKPLLFNHNYQTVKLSDTRADTNPKNQSPLFERIHINRIIKRRKKLSAKTMTVFTKGFA